MKAKKTTKLIPLFIALIVCTIFVHTTGYAEYTAEPGYIIWTAPVLKYTDGHIPYMEGKDGAFRPSDYLSRGEFCHAFSTLYELGDNGGKSFFIDVTADTPYAEDIKKVTASAIISGHYSGSFYPDAALSRAELIEAFCKTTDITEYECSFEDTRNHPSGKAVEYAYRMGFMEPASENAFCPDEPVSRKDAAVFINKFLGRSSAKSKGALEYQGINPFYDVPPTSKYFCDIMEATVPHKSTGKSEKETWYDFTYVKSGFSKGTVNVKGIELKVNSNGQFRNNLPDRFVEKDGKTYYASSVGDIITSFAGPQEIGEALYYFNEDHSILKSGYAGHSYFGSDGKYTTKSSTVDALVEKALKKCTTPEMTKEEKLRASYKYLRDNCKYLARPHQPRGSNAFVMESAKFMFRNMKGNCYCFASCFLLMARRIGYTQAYVVSGGVGTKNSDHAWVMIDGKIFDPELEYAYRYRYAKKKDYDLYNMNIDSTPFPYHFPNNN